MPNRGKYQASIAIHKTASGTVHSGRCDLVNATLYADGTNGVVCTLYDNTTNSGTVIFKAGLGTAERGRGFPKPFPRVCNTGIYAVLSGTNGEAIIDFIPE